MKKLQISPDLAKPSPTIVITLLIFVVAGIISITIALSAEYKQPSVKDLHSLSHRVEFARLHKEIRETAELVMELDDLVLKLRQDVREQREILESLIVNTKEN